MTSDEIRAELDAIASQATDGAELTDEQVSRYEQLEGDLESARKREELLKRHEARKEPAGLQVQTRADLGDGDDQTRAFRSWMATGKDHDELTELRAQTVGTTTEGGYTVPDMLRQKMIDRMLDFGGLAAAAETISTSDGQTITWPTLDDTANAAEIVAESGAPASAGADLVFGEKQLDAYKFVSTGTGNVPLKVSWELLQDSQFDIEGLVTRKLAERLQRDFAPYLITGTGTSQPEGITIGGNAAVEVFASFAAPTFPELVAFIHNLDPAYRGPGCSWLMNDATLGELRQIVDGNSRPIWQPNETSGAHAMPGSGSYGTLLGYPVVIDQAMPALGDDTLPLVFGNLREAYIVRRVRDITLVRLVEQYAVNGQVGFMAWMRADGAVQNDDAYIIGEGQID